MEEILHHLGCKNPANNGMKYLSSGAGFLPSTLCHSRKAANTSIKLLQAFLFERPLRSVFWKWKLVMTVNIRKVANLCL